MSQLNIKFKDGNELITFYEDSSYMPGCETCDYGSEYTNEIEITTTNYRIKLVFVQMYEYGFSIADAMRIFAVDLKNMTEQEFIEYIEREVRKYDALKTFGVNKVINIKTH